MTQSSQGRASRRDVVSAISSQGNIMQALANQIFDLQLKVTVLMVFTQPPEAWADGINTWLQKNINTASLDPQHFLTRLHNAAVNTKLGNDPDYLPPAAAPDADATGTMETEPTAEVPSLMDQILAGETKVLP